MDLKFVEGLLHDKFQEVEFSDCYLIEMDFSNASNKLQVFIDSDSGFGFDKCRRISRYLESYFDENGTFGEKYTLEVSSPGLSRPLKLKRQYIKNVGRLIKIKTNNGELLEGTLEDVVDDHLILKIKNIHKRVEIDMVNTAKILPSFK
jgi:ribosome maturation factor RimP